MSAAWGLMLGVGLALVWLSMWTAPAQGAHRKGGWYDKTQDSLIRAGAPGVTPWGLVGVSVALGAVVALVGTAISGAAVLGLAFGAIASRGPFALVTARARRNRDGLREVWPEAVDHLASGLRAGLSLPEALGQLGNRGPDALREPFRAFAEDFRASGRFNDSLDVLKARLADPVGDKVVESLRITREVGGSDVGTLLRTLSQFLRDDARTRGELEARQSWTVNAARLAVAAPWLTLAMLATRPSNAAAFNSASGATVLLVGGGLTLVAYRIMMRIGRLPEEPRVMR